nr:class C beta-lactamase [Vibrio fluvialis]
MWKYQFMMPKKKNLITALSLITWSFTTQANDQLQSVVDQQAHRIMQQFGVPGMAIGVTVDGVTKVYNYGFAETATQSPVTDNTIFELGSISKTFAATLASYAQQQGALSFEDKAEQYLPELANSEIGRTSVLSLGTYTAGGLPLQFPDEVTNHEEMMGYYANWSKAFPVDTQRQYSNPSIGLFGYIAATSLKADYSALIEQKMLPALGMHSTYVNVPKEKMSDYAFGYNAKGEAVRVNPGMLDAEAYGIKSTASDLIQYINANLGTAGDKEWQEAINHTHKGYYRASTFVQGLAWELYPYPVKLDALLEGNSADVILNPKPISKADGKRMNNAWINKTGSTGGFGGYIAFIPSEKAGVVILANKSYPNTERVKVAHEILTAAMK